MIRTATTPHVAWLLSLALLASAKPALAADHGDAPRASADRSTDIADVYAFLDPNDNSKLVLIMTVGGFVVPGEAASFGFFDDDLRYGILLETTGDARSDLAIRFRFDKRKAAANEPQRVSIDLPFGREFEAVTTPPSTGPTASAFVVTSDRRTGVDFFAGLVDDPFFFDIPGFLSFVSSVRAGAPDLAALARGRDTFAGYNVSAIALRLPVSMLRLRRTSDNPTGTVLGVQGIVERRVLTTQTSRGAAAAGRFVQVERMGNPGVNVVLVPFPTKDAYNLGTSLDDSRGRFAPEIVETLRALGTNDENIGILASVAVERGDFLRLDTALPSSGAGGGDSAGAGFPNGRRLRDDVVDTLLFFVANQAPIGDSVDANDVPLGDTFPFLAQQQTARAAGVVDDNTRN
jgi:hypothetical protein